MPPEIKNFRELIAWLVREHHKGVWYDMTKKLGVSSGLVYQWRDGTVKRPSDEHLDALCKTYKLDYWKVLGIITGRKPPSAAGWLIPLLIGIGLTTHSVLPAAATPQVVDQVPAEQHYVKFGRFRRYRRRVIFTFIPYAEIRLFVTRFLSIPVVPIPHAHQST